MYELDRTGVSLNALSLSLSRPSTPRDKQSRSDETKQGAGKTKRLICYRCGGKGHPARLRDVDEVGTEPSSDADSDLFGLDWGDDPITTINSVTEGDRQNSWWKGIAGIC